MFSWARRLFGKKKIGPSSRLVPMPTITQKWRLVYIMGEKKDRIDLGVFEGSRNEALEECYGRQMVWFFQSGIRHAVFGTYGVEPIED